eukprot:359192-Chlamydomonas_euryale.AAC.8
MASARPGGRRAQLRLNGLHGAYTGGTKAHGSYLLASQQRPRTKNGVHAWHKCGCAALKAWHP